MRRRSFTTGLVATAAAGSLLSAKVSLDASAADAAEIKMLTSVALTSALNELAPQFEHSSGDKLVIGYSLIADIRKRVLNGETADVIMLSRPVMDELQQKKRIVPGSIVNVAGTAVAVAVRAGAAKPDISTVAAFQRTLLAAKSVVYADPAKGGASGVYFAHVLQHLGIAAQMKPKTVLVPGGQAAEFVAEGKAELGIGQTSEIMPVAGAELVGPFPAELANTTMFAAGIGIGSKETEAANALIRYLTGPAAEPVFREKGFQPG
jgi:molybdate transport system substrate-binding protein